jgi:hypothetical protein
MELNPIIDKTATHEPAPVKGDPSPIDATVSFVTWCYLWFIIRIKLNKANVSLTIELTGTFLMTHSKP